MISNLNDDTGIQHRSLHPPLIFFSILSQAFLPSSPVTPTAVLLFCGHVFNLYFFFLCYHRMHSTSGVSGTGTRLDLIEWTLTGARTGNCFFVLIWHCMVMVIKQGVESGKHYQGVIVLGAVHFSFFFCFLLRSSSLHIWTITCTSPLFALMDWPCERLLFFLSTFLLFLRL